MSLLLVCQGAAPRISFGDELSAGADYVVTEDEAVDAVKLAIKKNKTVNNTFDLDGDYAYEYETLFGQDGDSSLYKLNIKTKNESASPSNLKKVKISTYLKTFDTEDEESFSSEEDKVIFLIKNYSKETKNLTMDILGEEFTITIPSKDMILNEEEVEEDIETTSTSTDSDIYKEDTEEFTVASDSDIEKAEMEDGEEEETTRFLDVEFLDPAIVDGKAAVAFSVPAEDIIRKAKAEEYSFETESAVITAFVSSESFSEPVSLEAREFDEDEEETMSEILHSSGKLFAGKKSFDIHFITDNGDEVEPEGSVDVSITLKKDALPENADPDSFTVYHMTEEEAMNASTMEFYAAEASATDELDSDIAYTDTVGSENSEIPFDELHGSTVEKDDCFETSFTTDSFSYFVISYNGYNQVFAYLYDEEGNLLPGDELSGYVGDRSDFNPLDFCANWGGNGGNGPDEAQNKWISAKTLTSLLGSRTEGYKYIDAYTDSDMTEKFNWIYFEKKYSSKKNYSGSWWVSPSEDKPTSAPSSSDGTSRKITSGKIYIKFNNEVVTSELQDEVEDNGYFLAKVPEGISEYATVNYKWYRSDDGVTFEEVVKKKAANKTYNIEVDSTGSKLFPSRDIAVDASIRRWYKADVYVDGELYKQYDPLQVKDYPSIMNGSFEEPDISLMGAEAGYDAPVGAEGLYWKTSAGDKQIEIIRAGTKANTNYGCASAADENQWVELNAEERGALYQHVLVQPGATLYWRFSHRGRSGDENMYMVIAPKKAVDDNSSTSDLITIAEKIESGEEGYTAKEGYQVYNVTDGISSWNTYEGYYEVPDGVWLLSFFFISNMGTTSGNFIDNVSFSTSVPGPIDGCANITAKETVSGLLSDDMGKLSMHVWLESADGNVATDKNGAMADRTVSFSEVSDEGNSYTKSVSFPNMPDDTGYTIKKVLYFDGSEVLPDAYVREGENYVVIRNDTVREDKGTGSTASFTAYDEAKDKISVEFTDSFEMTTVPITVSKKIVGNAVDADKAFSFTVSGTLKNGKVITNEISEEDKCFTLKGDEVKVIYVPFGSTVTIAENDYTSDKYVTYYEIVPGDVVKGREATLSNVTLDREVEFTNKRVEYVVTIKKVNENGNRLKGAELSVYDGRNLSDDTKLTSTVTEDANDWTVKFTFGDYTLSETAAPAGYKIADSITFNVSDTGVVTSDNENAVSTTDNVNYTITMTDTPLVGSVILENTINEEYSPFGTPSFIYEITKADGSYKKVVMLTMDSLKKNTALDLPAGDYAVKQIKVQRYVPETESMEFTVVDSETCTLSFSNTIKQYEKLSHVAGIVNVIRGTS